jgi:putative ABC transport system permease protein
LLKGNSNTALKEPFSIVFSETAAKKYFGKEDPIGQSLLITGDAHPAKVTGIMKDIPENSHIKADVVISMTTITQKFATGIDSQWGNYGASAYLLLLKAGVNPKKAGSKVSGLSGAPQR